MKEQFDNEEGQDDAFLAGLDEETKQMIKANAQAPQIESRVRHLIDEETEQEDEDRLQQIMADLEEF